MRGCQAPHSVLFTASTSFSFSSGWEKKPRRSQASRRPCPPRSPRAPATSSPRGVSVGVSIKAMKLIPDPLAALLPRLAGLLRLLLSLFPVLVLLRRQRLRRGGRRGLLRPRPRLPHQPRDGMASCGRPSPEKCRRLRSLLCGKGRSGGGVFKCETCSSTSLVFVSVEMRGALLQPVPSRQSSVRGAATDGSCRGSRCDANTSHGRHLKAQQ